MRGMWDSRRLGEFVWKFAFLKRDEMDGSWLLEDILGEPYF